MEDPIAKWYREQGEAAAKALDKLQAAQAAGASDKEIRQLELALERARYVGD